MTDIYIELTLEPVGYCQKTLTIHLKIHTIFRKLLLQWVSLFQFFVLLSCLQFCFYCIHLKFNFPRCLINQSNVPLTTIASRQIQPGPCFPPPFPESYSFGEHSGNKEEREDKGISAHVRPRQRWSQMRASLLHTCGRERDGSQSLWRQLENSPEPRLIESLSSSLWASWAEGRCSCTATGMRPGISSWQRLRRRRSVLRSRCEVELGPSRWRSVWDLSARDHVCEFLVRVGKCLQSSELIEYSVYQVYVHVPGLCCAANAAPMEGPDADTAAATGRERKKASNRMRRKDERGKEQRYRRVLKKEKIKE